MKIILIAFLASVIAADKERVQDGGFASKLGGHHSDDHVDHQAVLGSKTLADKFDELPPAEAQRRLRIIATQMDTNKDGIVEKNELSAWIENSLRSLDEETVQERMTEMDTNGDGKVSWEEYLKDAFVDPDVSRLDADDKKALEEDEKYFKAADVNKDGFLDGDELAAFNDPENFPHMHSTLIEITMHEKDANNDGAIDISEYLGDFASQPESEWYKSEKNRFMTEYDLDGDGVLRGEEIRKWLVPDAAQMAVDEAEHLIQGADKNADGNLTIDEIVTDYKRFVGSMATNYGETLEKYHTEL